MTLMTAAARYTGRRPTASAKPLVGSSSAKQVSPMTEPIVAAWAIVRPRLVCTRMKMPTTKPTGSQRVVVNR
jgi:hypothetical protein